MLNFAKVEDLARLSRPVNRSESERSCESVYFTETRTERLVPSLVFTVSVSESNAAGQERPKDPIFGECSFILALSVWDV